MEHTLSIPQVSVPPPLPVVKGQTTVPAPWESISSHYPRLGCRQPTFRGHFAALTFYDEFVQKYIGDRWIIGIRDITFSNFDSCDWPSNLKLDSNRQFFRPCDHEIWWMTSKSNRALLLYYVKLMPWICYERSFSEFYLSIWNQLVFNQRLQLFVQSLQPYLLTFAWRN